MDDGEVDSHSPGGSFLEPYSNFMDDSCVIQNDWDMLIGTQICSHKHICNPTTGPDNTHTHTCEHTHTHTIGSGEDEKLTKKRRPAGNKEAVRKYREKQKAVKVNLEVRNAELEKENQRIPDLQKENARLRRKLQEQGPRQDAVDLLLAENKRLRTLLSNLRRTIDSELQALEDVSYQKLRFAPNNVDRVGGAYLPAGGRCTPPPPCFPARPVNHNDTGGSSDDLDHTEGSLGWHKECELVKQVATCDSLQEELEDTCAEPSTRFGSEVGTPYSNAGTSPSGSKERPLVCPAKLAAAAAAAQKRDVNISQIVTTPPAPVYQQQLPAGGIPCPVASLPLPCFRSEPKEAASHPSVQAPLGDRWQEDCHMVSGEAEMSADSCPLTTTASLSRPEDIIQSVSKIGSGSTLGPSLSKKLRVEPNSSADLFASGCFYPDDVNQGGSAAAAAQWNDHLLPDVSDDWLEDCDFIDGVCQAHLALAIQNSCFEPHQETALDSSRPRSAIAAAAVVTQPTAISNQ
ncbi:unnamed protein product [Calypogeia fissa]